MKTVGWYQVPEAGVSVGGRASSEGWMVWVELAGTGMALWLSESHRSRTLASELPLAFGQYLSPSMEASKGNRPWAERGRQGTGKLAQFCNQN